MIKWWISEKKSISEAEKVKCGRKITRFWTTLHSSMSRVTLRHIIANSFSSRQAIHPPAYRISSKIDIIIIVIIVNGRPKTLNASIRKPISWIFRYIEYALASQTMAQSTFVYTWSDHIPQSNNQLSKHRHYPVEKGCERIVTWNVTNLLIRICCAVSVISTSTQISVIFCLIMLCKRRWNKEQVWWKAPRPQRNFM